MPGITRLREAAAGAKTKHQDVRQETSKALGRFGLQ